MTKTEVLKEIRKKCLDCCCDQENEVRECPCQECPLWKFRMGKDSTHVTTDAERARTAKMLERKRAKQEEAAKNA